MKKKVEDKAAEDGVEGRAIDAVVCGSTSNQQRSKVARTTHSGNSEVHSEINSHVDEGGDGGGGKEHTCQPRPTWCTNTTEDSGLLSPDSFEDFPDKSNVTFVPTSPHVESNSKSAEANGHDTHAVSMSNKLSLFAEQKEPGQQTNAAQTALRQLSKAQSYRPAIAMAPKSVTTLPKNPHEKAAMRRRSRMSRIPSSSATTNSTGKSTGISSKGATATKSTTTTAQEDTTAATQIDISSGCRDGSRSSTITSSTTTATMLDLEAIMESRHGAFSIPTTRSSSDDDNEDGNSFLSTDSSGPQLMEEHVDYSLLLNGARRSDHQSDETPPVVNLGSGSFEQDDSPALEEARSSQYETTITTAILVNDNDGRPMPDSERRRIQQETQQQMMENVHRAEVVDVENHSKGPMERRWRIRLIVASSLVVIGVILGGTFAGTRCNRNPNARGCRNNSENAIREGGGRAHDQCVDAISVSPFDNFEEEGNIFSTTGATPDHELDICGNSTIGKIGNQAVWFELEGTGMPIEMTIRSTVLFPTWLAAFGGNCDELQCLDDVINCQPDVDCSLLLPTLEGESYLFLAGGGNPFSFFIKIRETITNDVCSTALAMTAIDVFDTIIEGSNTNATLDRGLLSCNEARNNVTLGPSVWYSVVGTGAPLHASTCRNYDEEYEDSPSAVISVYDGNCTALQCTESVSYVACGNHNHATWPTAAGEIYFVVLSGSLGELSRDFSFSIRATQQSNDICTMATAIEIKNDAITVEISNLHATNDGVIANCIESSDVTSSYKLEHASWPGSFFELEGTGGLIRIFFPCSPSGIGISVYSGSCGDLQCVFGAHVQVCSSEDDDPLENSRNELAWVSEPQKRYILHATTSNAEELFEVFVQDVAENDICAMATSLDDVLLNDQVVWGSTFEATIPEEFSGFCGDVPAATSGGVWYTVTGRGTILHVDTCLSPYIANITSGTGSSELPPLGDFKMFDTQISVFSGDCGNLKCQGGNDQSCGDQSSFEWFAIEGQQYFILVHGFQVERGDFGLSINEAFVSFTDKCEDVADPIDIGSSTFSTTISAEVDVTDACGGFTGQGPGVWFKLIGDGNRLAATTCDVQTNFNSRVTVFQGDDCDSIQCFTAAYDECDFIISEFKQLQHGVVTFDTVLNQTYYLLIHGSDGESGFFNLRVAEAIENDMCENAAETVRVDDGAIYGSNEASFRQSNRFCKDSGSPESLHSPSVWYRIDSNFEEDVLLVTASACHNETTFGAIVNVYFGECGEQVCMTRSASCSTEPWMMKRGETYYIIVQGRRSEVGSFKLTVSGPAHRENSACSSSEILRTGDATLGDLSFSPFTAIETCTFGVAFSGQGLWYKVQGNGNNLAASTCSDEFTAGSFIVVYSGDCIALNCTVDGENYCGNNAQVSWESEDGKTYYIFVYTHWAYAPNIFSLTFSELSDSVTLAANDKCDDAIGLVIDDGVPIASSLHLSAVDTVPRCFGSLEPIYGGIWYSVIGEGMILRVFETTPSFTTTQFLIFEGTCEALECVDASDARRPNAVTWFAEVGVKYFILIEGTLEVEFAISEITNESSNTCEDSRASEKITVGQSIIMATNKGSLLRPASIVPCGGDLLTTGANPTSLGVWSTFIGTGSRVRASTCSEATEFNTTVTIYYGGNDCASLECVPTLDLSCDESLDRYPKGSMSRSFADWDSEAGREYHIFVQGKTESDKGVASLSMSELSPNDLCGEAVQISASHNNGDSPIIKNTTELAGPDYDVGVCGGSHAYNSPGLWYKIVGNGAFLTASTCIESYAVHSGLDTQLAVFDGANCGTLECVTGNDDYCGTLSRVTWFGHPQKEYWVLLNGYLGSIVSRQDFELTVFETEAVQHNTCEESSLLAARIGSTSLSMIDGVVVALEQDSSPPACEINDSPPRSGGSWFTVVGTGGQLVASTCNRDTFANTSIQVYSGPDCADLVCVDDTEYTFCEMEPLDAEFLNAPNFQQGVASWLSVSGLNYHIYVYATDIDGGIFTLEVKQVPRNDACPEAVSMSIGDTIRSSTESASIDDVEICQFNGGTLSTNAPGQWFRLELLSDEGAELVVCRDYNAEMTIFEGDGCDSLTCMATRYVFWNLGCFSYPIPAEEGAKIYYILVHGREEAGMFDLAINPHSARRLSP